MQSNTSNKRTHPLDTSKGNVAKLIKNIAIVWGAFLLDCDVRFILARIKMQTKDINARIIANIAPKKPRAKKETPSQKRREIVNAKIEALECAISAIKEKIRDERFLNSWKPAYYSAITTIELEIAKLKT